MIDKTLDRTKVLYEQYFLGMQKQPPAQLHTDVERRLRELQQLNIRNTGLRYRFATIQQKFGSYNSYWRRTLRQIENGTYIRNLAKISRNAAMTGEEVPEEILAAMPKRMREQVKRDREQALAAKRRRAEEAGDVDIDMGDLDDGDAAVINSSPPKITRPPPMQKNTHVLGGDDDFDIEAFFASVTDETPSTKPTLRTMPIARVATPSAPPKAIPRAVEDDPTGVHEQRAPRAVEDEPTGVVTPVVRALPGLPTKQSSIPGVTNLAPPRGTATPPPGTPITRPPSEPKTQAVPVVPPPRGAPPPIPRPPAIPRPAVPSPARTQAMPVVPMPAKPGAVPRPVGAGNAPSQQSRPNPIAPGASSGRQPIPVQSMQGPFEPTPVAPKPRPTMPAPKPEQPAQRPPPGMNAADVNALYAKYVKAKEMVGEEAGPGAYSKLMKTINTQAPKIMEQYKAKGVEFSVVVKDNQVIIKAKPKT